MRVECFHDLILFQFADNSFWKGFAIMTQAELEGLMEGFEAAHRAYMAK